MAAGELTDNKIALLRKAQQRFQRRNKRLVPNHVQLLQEARELSRSEGKKLGGRLTVQNVKDYLSQNKDVARFETARKIRPTHFQTMPIIKLGVYHIDFSGFHPEWAEHNDGNSGFIVIVENFTNKLFVYPSPILDPIRNWKIAIDKFMAQKNVGEVNTLCSDNDAVGQSSKFKQYILQKYNIRWHTLKRIPKAFLAERFNGYIKKHLSITLDMESRRKKQQVKRWIDLLQPLYKAYNRQIIPNTNFRRDQVNPDNFEKFLSQLKGGDPQPEMNFHFARAGPFIQERWNRRLFKFDLGQKVWTLAKTNPSVDPKKREFLKANVYGVWDKKKEYTIAGRQLRSTKQGHLIPVYSLKEFNVPNKGEKRPMMHFYFYENQLKAVP